MVQKELIDMNRMKKVKNTFSIIKKRTLNMEQNSMFRHIRNYFASSVFTKFLAFVSIPIFTRLLGPEGYGATGLFVSITSVVSIISAFGLDSSVKRYYFEENSNLSQFIGTNLIFITFFNLILMTILNYFSEAIIVLTGIQRDILMWGLIVGILFSYRSIVFGVWQAQKHSGLIGKISALNGIITIVISIFLVIKMNSYLGQIYGYLIGAIIITILLLIKIKKQIAFQFNYKYLSYSLFLGLPLVINQLAGYILSFFDRIIINKYFGLVDVGIYSFAYNIAMIMEMVIYSINSAFIPIMFEKMNKKEEFELQTYFVIFTKITLLSAMILMLFSSEIATVLADERYIRALPIIPIVIYGYIFKYLYTFYSNVEYFHKKTKALAFFSIVAGVVNILLNIIFVPQYGAVAAAYTTTVSYALLFVLHFFYVTKILNFNVLNLKKIIGYVCIMTIITLIILSYTFFYGNSLLIIFVKIFAVMIISYIFFKTIAI